MGLAWDMLFALRAHEPVRHLVVAPISHFAGSFLFALTGVGSTHYLHSGVNVESILSTIEDKRIEVLFLPPTVIRMLMGHPRINEFDLSSLKALVYAGAPMSRNDVLTTISVFGPVLMTMLGQTEANGPITYMRPEEYRIDGDDAWQWRLQSIGRASITRQVEIMDEGGQILGPGVAGEVVVRGWANCKGYLNNAEATQELMQHGWLHTGDVGIKDDEGYIVLVDRKKDMIISGGFNVFSAEVEQVLQHHPSVETAAVIGVPDEKWGEVVMAVIELASGAEVDVDALILFCKQELGSIKAPKFIRFESLPRNPAGKVLKRELRDRYWQGKERLI
jgi:acyl-CoA synthetase (AMP-forming)/AMP-acid ligase II